MNQPIKAIHLKTKLPTGIKEQCLLYDGSDLIYLLGGWKSNNEKSDAIYTFSLSSHTLQKVGNLPGPSFSGTVEWNEDKNGRNIVYFGGGRDWNAVYTFNLANGTSSKTAELPTDFIHHASSFRVRDNSSIVYIFGGFDFDGEILAFDMASHRNLKNAGSLKFDTRPGVAVRVGNMAYIYGGLRTGIETLFELNLDNFDMIPVGDENYPQLRYAGKAIWDGGQFIYLIGGYKSNNNTYFPAGGITRFDVATKKSRFIRIENYPVGEKTGRYYRKAPDCVWVNKMDRIYCFGGFIEYEDRSKMYDFLDDIFYIDFSP